MKLLIRIVLLGAIVVLGFTVVFPEWFDFRDQLLAQHHADKEAAQERERMHLAQQTRNARIAELKEHEAHALDFSRNVWNDVAGGSYGVLSSAARHRSRRQTRLKT